MGTVLQTRGCRGCAALRLLGAVPHPPAAESALHPVRWLVQAASSAPVPASPCPTGTVGTWICCPCLRTSLCPRLRASVLTVPGGGEVPVTDHRGALSLIAWVHLTLWAGGVWATWDTLQAFCFALISESVPLTPYICRQPRGPSEKTSLTVQSQHVRKGATWTDIRHV